MSLSGPKSARKAEPKIANRRVPCARQKAASSVFGIDTCGFMFGGSGRYPYPIRQLLTRGQVSSSSHRGFQTRYERHHHDLAAFRHCHDKGANSLPAESTEIAARLKNDVRAFHLNVSGMRVLSSSPGIFLSGADHPGLAAFPRAYPDFQFSSVAPTNRWPIHRLGAPAQAPEIMAPDENVCQFSGFVPIDPLKGNIRD